jgi:hypothetical protein
MTPNFVAHFCFHVYFVVIDMKINQAFSLDLQEPTKDHII